MSRVRSPSPAPTFARPWIMTPSFGWQATFAHACHGRCVSYGWQANAKGVRRSGDAAKADLRNALLLRLPPFRPVFAHPLGHSLLLRRGHRLAVACALALGWFLGRHGCAAPSTPEQFRKLRADGSLLLLKLLEPRHGAKTRQ